MTNIEKAKNSLIVQDLWPPKYIFIDHFCKFQFHGWNKILLVVFCVQSTWIFISLQAFESRQESHLEIVQQIVIILTQNKLTKDTKCLHFLEPVLNYLAVNSSLSNERYLVTRELCFNVASLVPSSFVAGRFLMRSLLCLNFFYLHQTQVMILDVAAGPVFQYLFFID